MRVVLVSLLFALPLSSALAQGGSFVDTFDRLDAKRWQVSDGWSNGAHQSCVWSRDNTRVANGNIELSITDTPRGDRAFSCGELMSRAMYGYGTYEVRMKPAALNSGIVSAFFTYTGRAHGNPHDEIDFEFIAARPGSVDAAYFAKGKGPNIVHAELNFDPRAGFNDYAFHWTPDRMTWYANGTLLREVKRTESEPFPTTPGKLYISVWSGSPQIRSWLGLFEYPGQPLVAIYQHVAYTKLGEGCQFPRSLVCQLGKEELNKK
jgi:endo-1,3-1,4-beta-glycanase ExoK